MLIDFLFVPFMVVDITHISDGELVKRRIWNNGIAE